MTVAEKQAEWVPLSEAARRIGISMTKLSLMVKEGKFQIRKDPKDYRKKLVNMVELREFFGQN